MTGETRRFHFGALVTVVTDTFVCPGGIGDLYEILNWMTGDNLMTHQLPLAADAVRPDLLGQHPWLSEVSVPEAVKDELSATVWLAGATARWGEWHDLTPSPAAWGSHDPIEDLVAMGADPSLVIQVEVDGDV